MIVYNTDIKHCLLSIGTDVAIFHGCVWNTVENGASVRGLVL